MAKIVNHEFQVNVLNKIGKFWKWPQRGDKIFYTSNSIVKCIEPPQIAGSRDEFEFCLI